MSHKETFVASWSDIYKQIALAIADQSLESTKNTENFAVLFSCRN